MAGTMVPLPVQANVGCDEDFVVLLKNCVFYWLQGCFGVGWRFDHAHTPGPA